MYMYIYSKYIYSTEKKRRKIVTPDEINSIFSKKGTDSDNDIFSDKSSRSSASNNDDADDDSEVENEEVVETGASVGGFANELGQKFQAAYAQAMNKVEDRSITDTATDSKNSMSMDARSMSSEVNAFDNELTSGNPVDQFSDASVTGDDQIPNWLLKADRVAEKKKKEAMLKGRKKKQLTDDWRFWLGIIATAGFASAAYSMYQQTGGFDPNISPFSSFGFGPSDVTGGGGDELII